MQINKLVEAGSFFAINVAFHFVVAIIGSTEILVSKEDVLNVGMNARIMILY